MRLSIRHTYSREGEKYRNKGLGLIEKEGVLFAEVSSIAVSLIARFNYTFESIALCVKRERERGGEELTNNSHKLIEWSQSLQ